ncbi:MAG: asparagine synthase C-terminal domain-containing protein, partial [Planctomycetota bacterium]
AARHLDVPPVAFTGFFEEGPAYDEREHARRAAAEAGVRLVEVPIRAADLLAHLRELAVALEGPIAGPGSLPQLVVAGRAREEVTVLVTGQGGDEIFGGYARTRIAWLAGAGKLDPAKLPAGLEGYRPLVARLSSGGGSDLADRYFRLVHRGGGLEDLLGDATRERFDAYDARSAFGDAFRREDGDDFHRMSSWERRALLPALLHVEDRVTMARSLESRVPLLDPALVSLAARIPSRIAFGEAESKRILRIAARGLAPASAIDRRDKMGFPVPLGEWAAGPLAADLRERLEDGPLVSAGILAPGAPERLLAGAGGHGRHLWFFLLLSEWMDATGARP